MKVRLKMTCGNKFEGEPGEGEKCSVSFNFHGVKQGPEDDELYGKFTPCANLDFRTVNPTAAAQLEQGKTYYVTIEPAE